MGRDVLIQRFFQIADAGTFDLTKTKRGAAHSWITKYIWIPGTQTLILVRLDYYIMIKNTVDG